MDSAVMTEQKREQQANVLKSYMNLDLERLGNDPRLIWLLGRVTFELMTAFGTDEFREAVKVIEAVARELGADDGQVAAILEAAH